MPASRPLCYCAYGVVGNGGEDIEDRDAWLASSYGSGLPDSQVAPGQWPLALCSKEACEDVVVVGPLIPICAMEALGQDSWVKYHVWQTHVNLAI